MRIRAIYTSLLIFIGQGVQAQNLGNSSFLKYGFTANQNASDVTFHGFQLTNSASKMFVLKHLPTNTFASGASFMPVTDFGAAESSGEIVKVNSPKMPSGISLGFERTGNDRHQGFLTFNSRIKIKKAPKLRLNGYVIYGNQSFEDDRTTSAWKRNDKNTNAYAKLSSHDYNAKHRFSLEGLWVKNRGTITERFETQKVDDSEIDGDVLMAKLKWLLKHSVNHTLITELISENFTLDGRQTLALSDDKTLRVTNTKLQVLGEIKRQKTKFRNTILFADNQQFVSSRGATNDKVNYTLGMWQTQVNHLTKPNGLGLSYSHNVGYHSTSGMIFNPGVKFFKNVHNFKFDVGLKQVSRTPSLITEFSTFFNDEIADNVTSRQEKLTKIFASSKFEFASTMFIVFKYVQTSSNNKWLYDLETNTLNQQKIKYSTFYLKLYKNFNRRSRFMFLYRNITPETNTAKIFAEHLITGNMEYRIFNQSKRVFKRYRRFNFSVDLKSTYMTQHNLPFERNGAQAVHKGGVFADSHLKLRLGKDYSYYRNTLKPLRLRSTIIRLGVNNLLNTRATIQPIEANNLKPILPRQVYSSITFEI